MACSLSPDGKQYLNESRRDDSGQTGEADMNTSVAEHERPQGDPVPLAISRLIESAVATFDADRTSARCYLMKASALLRVRGAVHQSAHHRPGATPAGGLAFWQLKRLVDHIEKNLTAKITGEDLAALINVSLGQLFRGFKTSVGVTPFQYVTRRRIDLACELMKTSAEPLSQIAILCGLCDQSHFCRVFRREVGATPAQWRRQNAEAPAARMRGAFPALSAASLAP